jgi:methionyl-tRNA synthetase
MYVWFDALSNYINGLNFGGDKKLYEEFWLQSDQEKREVVHVLGKGVAKFHLLYWIGMLLSAKISLPTAEFIHGYILLDLVS